MEECVSSLMEGGSWRSTHPLFVLHIRVLVLYHYCEVQVLMCLYFIHILSFSFLFHRNGVFWDACWSWLGARPRTALWQTGGNDTHAVRSAVGRAVGRTAHTGGAGLWNRRQAHGVLAVQRQYSFRRQPEVTQRGKGVTTQTCFLPRGRRAQARSVGEGASPCQANLGVFHGRLLGEAYGRRVRALQGEGRGFPLTFCLFVCLFGGDDSDSDDDDESSDDRGDDRSGCGDGGNEEIDSFDRMMGYVQESTHALQREIDEESEESLATKWTPPTLVHQVNKKRGRKKTIKWIRSMAAREREMCPPLPMTNQQYRLLNYMYLSTVQRIVLWRTYKKRVSMKREIVEKELQLSNDVSQVTKGTVKGVSDSYKKKTSDELQGKGMTYKEQLSGIQELSESA